MMLEEFISNIEFNNQVIAQWVQDYYGGVSVLVFALVAFIYLYITCEKLRYKFLAPIALMMFIVLNPILYQYIFYRIIYWRLLWMFPSAILIGGAVTIFLTRRKNIWFKWIIVLIMGMNLIIQDHNLFKHGEFVLVENWEKISQEAIDVSDIMLAKSEAPKAVIHSFIFTEVRQYAPEIDMLYGRNVYGYIRHVGVDNAAIYIKLEEYENPDYRSIFRKMEKLGYNFLVLKNDKIIDEEVFDRYGYIEIGRTENHVIYYYEEN